MTFGVPCWADDILDLIPVALAKLPGMTADRVFDSLLRDEDHLAEPPASDFVTVTPRSMAPRSAPVTGGGRLTTVFDLQVRIAQFVRIGDDQALRDKRVLRDRTRSVLQKALKLIGLLQMWLPANQNGDCLLVEPGRIQGGPEFTPRRQASGGSAWSVAATTWQFSFRAVLD